MSLRWKLMVLAASTAAVALPSPASAGWSPIVRLARSSSAGAPVVATNAHGDVAVGWFTVNAQTAAARALHVAVRRGPSGRFATHVVVAGRGIALTGLALAVDGRGEVTVAWVQRGTAGGGRLRGRIGVRAAFRTAAGRWSVARRVATISPFFYALPQLAVRPDRSVLLAFNAGTPSTPGVAYAWRRPGRIFTATRPLTRGTRPRGYYLGGFGAGVDASGRAYVAGVRTCDTPASRAEIHVAAPGHARFGAARVLSRAPARDLRLAVNPSGGATLAWLAESCSTTELLPGAVQAVRVGADGAALGAVSTVAPSPATALTLSAGPDRSAEVGWTTFGPAAPDGAVQIGRSDGTGAFGAPFPPPGGWVAVAADAAGDQLVENVPPASNGFPTRAAVRTPGGAISVSPLRPRFITAGAAAVPFGRGAAVATATRAGVQVTAWRP